MSILLRCHLRAASCLCLILIGLSGCVPASSEVGDSSAAGSSSTSSEPDSRPTEAEEELDLPSINRHLVAQGQILPVTAEVELGRQIIGLEVAETSQQQAIGLMARESLPDDRGMLFPFEPARPVSFWMKNVLIPLDMIFIYEGEVIAIAKEVPPCETNPCPTYGPGQHVIDHVIELRGGRAAELGIQAGDTVEIDWLESSFEE